MVMYLVLMMVNYLAEMKDYYLAVMMAMNWVQNLEMSLVWCLVMHLGSMMV
jgi:hypothetical protein